MADRQDVTRKLAAILYADVAGYSRLTGADEEGTHRTVADYLEVISGMVADHGGRVVHYAGDAVLADFSSVVTAVKCAVEVQKELAARNVDIPDDRKVQFRIGVNLGDVIVDRDDIYGNGVNVAARLEGLADPGGICVSGAVLEQVQGKVDVDFEDRGLQEVKNIAQPVQSYRVVIAGSPARIPAPPRRNTPSIAVLPFDNLSAEPDQEFFADGMAEDIITDLSRFSWFSVIARNSSFTYKGRSVDVKQVAQELGVRYVLEGSVRKAGTRVRVAVQLIDASTGSHIWAKRYDRELENIFALQDEISETIVAAIEPELSAVERERARRTPPENLDAWGLCQRGIWHHLQFTPSDNAEAQALFRRACELDPNFSSAYARLAHSQVTSVLLSYDATPEDTLKEARKVAQWAVALNPKDPLGHHALGRVQSLLGEHDLAIAELETAIELTPSFAHAHFSLAHALYASGDVDKVIPLIETAIRLSPRDPALWSFLSVRARAHLSLCEYDQAIEWAHKALQVPNVDFGRASFALLSALGHLGRTEEATALLAQISQYSPKLTISALVQGTLGHFKLANQREHIVDGLRKAGLPE